MEYPDPALPDPRANHDHHHHAARRETAVNRDTCFEARLNYEGDKREPLR
jgi:hypothetical protein